MQACNNADASSSTRHDDTTRASAAPASPLLLAPALLLPSLVRHAIPRLQRDATRIGSSDALKRRRIAMRWSDGDGDECPSSRAELRLSYAAASAVQAQPSASASTAPVQHKLLSRSALRFQLAPPRQQQQAASRCGVTRDQPTRRNTHQRPVVSPRPAAPSASCRPVSSVQK